MFLVIGAFIRLRALNSLEKHIQTESGSVNERRKRFPLNPQFEIVNIGTLGSKKIKSSDDLCNSPKSLLITPYVTSAWASVIIMMYWRHILSRHWAIMLVPRWIETKFKLAHSKITHCKIITRNKPFPSTSRSSRISKTLAMILLNFCRRWQHLNRETLVAVTFISLVTVLFRRWLLPFLFFIAEEKYPG